MVEDHVNLQYIVLYLIYNEQVSTWSCTVFATLIQKEQNTKSTHTIALNLSSNYSGSHCRVLRIVDNRKTFNDLIATLRTPGNTKPSVRISDPGCIIHKYV